MVGEQVFVDRTGRRRGLMRAVSIALAASLLGLSTLIMTTVLPHVT
ncbi:hypothetical protein F4560_008137 [Saccharothrix ecbatanensis]|uniref:Uncharacterized protein n=1 Tax=Saccharothrix ecbatanensis TaxID=1105145 RepID=A0A7W9HTW6_9PSEU|nr:hypothetical protein [Saccharothrix ecbatanensis]